MFRSLPYIVPLGLGITLSALAQDTVISGTILDSHGRVLPQAAAVLMDINDSIQARTLADAAGHFTLRTNQTGFMVLMLGGTGHYWRDLPVVFDTAAQSIQLSARLEVPAYKPVFGDLIARGDSPKSPLHDHHFQKELDGTYTLDVTTTEPEVLFGVQGLTAGTELLTLPGSPDYRLIERTFYSVAKPARGQLHVILDPKKLPRDGDPGVQFADPTCRTAQLLEMQADLRRWNRLAGDLWEQRKKASPRTAEADIPWPSPPPDWQARLRERAQHAQDRFVRQAWLFESLWLATAAKQVEASWVRSTLQELTPASPFWQWNPGVAAAAVLASGQPEQYQEYLNQIIDGLPHASLKGTVVAAIFTQLQRERRADLAQPWLVRMKTEFAQNRRVKAALARYESERKVKPGKPVPAFSARSLDDPKVAYTNASLAGKVYLLDFWATWCGPCAYQIPYIQRAYARYKSKGFEVLSYSVDGSREAVRRYRAERFPMPWLHAIDAELRGRESPLAILFEVYEYPTAVLVDGREGKIVAVGEEITGDKLEAMLARFWPE